ncbi:response regulator transcription factor [Treponema primitia]|uniref:helix-turn-helix transcriptional regulator n=1 Tax=Treponema primitia TaxID=88058 RepID=UPI00397E9FD1
MSKAQGILPLCKRYLTQAGFQNVQITSNEKDALYYEINELKPGLIFIESCFYQSATPFMMGKLLRTMPALRIVAFSIGEFPDELAMGFFFCGVKSYLNFRDEYSEVCSGLQKILHGEEYWMQTVQRRIELQPEIPDYDYDISPRQMEVLRLVCNGFKVIEIGNTLQISKRTVETHKQDLYDLLHVRNEGELIKIAFILDLVQKAELCFYGGA